MFIAGMVAIVLGYVVVYYGIELLYSTISYQVGNTGVTYGAPFSVLLGLTPAGGKYLNPVAPFTFSSNPVPTPTVKPASTSDSGSNSSGGKVVSV